jgi:hypothetical protein
MKTPSRREMLAAAGLAAATGLASFCYGRQSGEAAACQSPVPWQYVPLAPAEVAAEAYRLMPEGGCMYGVFRAVLIAWAKKAGQSLDTFPFHMFRYGEGGIAGWGSICGTLNAGAALIGLFENDKARREKLISELFAWYEQAELPTYRPAAAAPAISKSVSNSVLCHVSVAHWCTASGAPLMSPAMKERCRRLTAEVATKTVELLNRKASAPGGAAVAIQAAPTKPPKSIGKMDCTACHRDSKEPP